MNSVQRFASILLLTFIWIPCHAQFVSGVPEAVGFSSKRLERIDHKVMTAIEQDQLAGAISLIVKNGRAVHFKPYGMMDRENNTPMPKDAIFRIASMSKAVTSVGVMLLYEEGHFLLNDPVHKFIPAFRNPQVAVPPADDAPDRVQYATVDAKREITIRHLLTHTAGLTYGSGLAEQAYREADLQGWYFADKDETIGQCIERLATLPLHGHPGEAWQYGYSTDVLGYFIEKVSGLPLDRFFSERIFKPLNMKDSYFFLPREKAERLAPVYGFDDQGNLNLMESNTDTDYLHGPRKCFSGGAGLLSTATDYARFLQMLLNGGELEGIRLLSPHTVKLMHVNHVEDKYQSGDRGFGLGFWVLQDLGRYGEVGSLDSYGWGSAYYPLYWVDPRENMIALFMTQLMPAKGQSLKREYQNMVYHAMIK
jgi:CubicO group peptidase (beta-lactamase class C family)